jgi:hypothetical protein
MRGRQCHYETKKTKMKQVFYILTISVLMTSCATVLNRPYQNVKIYTTEPSQIIHRYDTIKTVNNKVNLSVERKKEILSIVAMTDSITKSIDIKPRNSFAYWLNIYPTPLFWTGFLIDKNNPKCYSYPKRIYINSADTINKYYGYSQSNNKGELHLHLSLPHFNFFNLAPEGEKNRIGASFWGLTIGLDYYHSKNQFVNLDGSYAFGLVFPIPAAIDLSGEHELMSSWYIGLSNNHKLGRFTLGYGLSFGRNYWDFRYYNWGDPPPPTREPASKSHYALGLIFPTYFELGEPFNVGVIYRPSFYRPTLTNKFAYEHLISIDFAWKIRLKK